MKPHTELITKSALPTVERLLPLIECVRRTNDPFRASDLNSLSMRAAVTLGSLPKNRPKIWSGWIGDQHYWRGRLAIHSDGQVVEVIGVQRGLALVKWTDPQWLEGERHLVLPVSELNVYKNPAASWLGRLKFGVKERPSAAKAAAAKRNGSKPCRPGKKRGRPPKAPALPNSSG